jgi:hypothetical protein
LPFAGDPDRSSLILSQVKKGRFSAMGDTRKIKIPASDVAWTPRLKQPKSRSVPQSSASAQTAHAALANMTKIVKCRAAGCAMGEGIVANMVGAELPTRPKAGQAGSIPPYLSGYLVTIVLGVAGVATAGSLAGLGMIGPSGYAVDGTVTMATKPLGNVMLYFHTGQNMASCMTAITATDGRFSVHGLPEGTYKITVRSQGDDLGGIPTSYGNPTTTKLSLSVTDDVSNTKFVLYPR